MVVPFAAGGSTDIVTRTVAEPMSTALGQQIIVTNVAGAGGTLAAGQVATAAADGYTVLMHHIGMSTAPSLYTDLAYDPLTSFKTIGLVTEVPMTIVGRSDLPPTTLAELKDVTANAATINYANAGVAPPRTCAAGSSRTSGASTSPRSSTRAPLGLEDLVGKQVDFMCDQTTNTTKQITSGAARPTASPAPSGTMRPGRPTTAEGGSPDISITVWHDACPAGTPPEVVAALTAALKVALADAAVVSKFAGLGTTPVSADQQRPRPTPRSSPSRSRSGARSSRAADLGPRYQRHVRRPADAGLPYDVLDHPSTAPVRWSMQRTRRSVLSGLTFWRSEVHSRWARSRTRSATPRGWAPACSRCSSA